MNSFSFCLLEKFFPSILNENLAGSSTLRCRIFSFKILTILCHFLLACEVSAREMIWWLCGIPLYMTFFPCSLYALCGLVWSRLVWDSPCFLYLDICLLLQAWEVFSHNFLKCFFKISSLSCLLGPLWCWYWYTWCYPKDRLLCFNFFSLLFFSRVVFIILPSTPLTHFLYHLVCCSFLLVSFSSELLYSSALAGSFLYFLVLCENSPCVHLLFSLIHLAVLLPMLWIPYRVNDLFLFH